jgi:HEPN domain-containing protein
LSEPWNSLKPHRRVRDDDLYQSLALAVYAAEYEERLIKEGGASEAVRDAERVLEWIEELLKK